VGEERDLRRQYRDGLRVEQSESQVRSHSYPTSRVRSYGPKNCINVNKGFTQSDTVCQFERAYSQTSEASIRLSKPRSPIWFRAIPGAPIRPQTAKSMYSKFFGFKSLAPNMYKDVACNVSSTGFYEFYESFFHGPPNT
jgi:hypothetical protein